MENGHHLQQVIIEYIKQVTANELVTLFFADLLLVGWLGWPQAVQVRDIYVT